MDGREFTIDYAGDQGHDVVLSAGAATSTAATVEGSGVTGTGENAASGTSSTTVIVAAASAIAAAVAGGIFFAKRRRRKPAGPNGPAGTARTTWSPPEAPTTLPAPPRSPQHRRL